MLRVGNKLQYAHRFFYVWTHGVLPELLELDHLCRIRECCNFQHLEAVTRKVNARRGAKAKLNDQQVGAIRTRLAAGEIQRTIAGDFGVSVRLVSNIKTGDRWG
jgi:HNH endonuclease